MKKLLFILVLALTSCHTLKSDLIAEPLIPYVEDYYDVLDKYDISRRIVSDNVKSIELVNFARLPDGNHVAGYFDRVEQIVYIDSSLIEQPVLLKVVLFHELGHSVGLMHSCEVCPDIMSTYSDVPNIKHYYAIPSFYLEQERKHFLKLKVFIEMKGYLENWK